MSILPPGVPWALVFVPIGLLGFDVGYKWAIQKAAPADSVADISLAGLTFSMVHVLNDQLSDGGGRLGVGPLIWLLLMFLVWPLTLFWAERIRKSASKGLRLFSYFLGYVWFILGTGYILALVP
jgi:hypothetical protein